MSGSRLKVVWICNFSNEEIRSRLSFRHSWFDSFLRLVSRSNISIKDSDYGIWITNGINEMKSFHSIDLHVISPHYGIKGRVQEFGLDGINYHVYRDESFQTVWKVKERLGFMKGKETFSKNMITIDTIVQSIKPDIIQVIGAENINYSQYILDFNMSIPVIVQLQTLIADPKVYNTIRKHKERIREVEGLVLRKADYIFTVAKPYISRIKMEIDSSALIIANNLAVGVTIDREIVKKAFDFVYFSVDISKAADLAIQAFSLAKKSFPDITLDIIGYYSSEYKAKLDDMINKENLRESITFEGRLPTHEDVLNHIKKARFALIPLRPDLFPSTIREAMSVGCPVISTINESTPGLNAERESLLLCNPEDAQDMATKMCMLLSDDIYASHIRENAYKTLQDRYDNHAIIRKMVDSYSFIYTHFHFGTPIPEEYLS